MLWMHGVATSKVNRQRPALATDGVTCQLAGADRNREQLPLPQYMIEGGDPELWWLTPPRFPQLELPTCTLSMQPDNERSVALTHSLD